MDNYPAFYKWLKKDWYVQGFNAVPLFLNASALSGFTMKKMLGYSYSAFLFNYRSGYGEMAYLTSDLKRIKKIVMGKLSKDAHYLENVKRKYNVIFSAHRKFFSQINKIKIASIEDKKLLRLLKNCIDAQIDSVGLAHILDPIGLEFEKDFKKRLFLEIGDNGNFNKYLTLLLTPRKPPFIVDEENELALISELEEAKKEKFLRRHCEKYFWIRNSYAGPQKLSIEFFRKRSKRLKLLSGQANLKCKILSAFRLSKEIRELMRLIEFAAIWQDERKANALEAIGYLGKVIEEVSFRVEVPVKALYYLKAEEVLSLTSLNQLKSLETELKLREKGMFVFMDSKKEVSFSGNYYKKLLTFQQSLTGNLENNEDEIHGSTASMGTAVGKVKIVKDLGVINKVKNGDVLVASMTRPEFTSAIKKVVAIVTDEGGITSHAAIIAREFGIPCVVGTKVATKILRDGMLVEVRANHGLVKILN